MEERFWELKEELDNLEKSFNEITDDVEIIIVVEKIREVRKKIKKT